MKGTSAGSRPCRYCIAAWEGFAPGSGILPGATDCEWTHRDDPRVYALAAAMAAVFQHRPPTDEQTGWFLDDADAVIDDFDPPPAKWRVRTLPPDSSEFDFRFRINDVTYVIQAGGHKEKVLPVRLATLRSWQREADEDAKRSVTR